MGSRGLRSAVLSYVPRWLSNRPGLNTGYKILYTAARMLDQALEATVQGMRCWLPGYPVAPPGHAIVDASTALPYVARSRGLIQGESESDAAFAARSQTWLQDWQEAGSSEQLVKEIQRYLGNTPTVRVVDRSGLWVSIDSAGNITRATAAWDWDSVTAPERIGWWSDLWIIVYPCEWAITGTALVDLVGLWGTYEGDGTGHQVDRAAVSSILQLVGQWKGAHAWVEAIVFSYDATLFVPGTPASGDPDGTWAYWGKIVSNAMVPARTGAADGRARYWVPAMGG